jgi:hypothetical protein
MSAMELKNQIIEELEFELIAAARSSNQYLVPGLERAMTIIEEIYSE